MDACPWLVNFCAMEIVVTRMGCRGRQVGFGHGLRTYITWGAFWRLHWQYSHSCVPVSDIPSGQGNVWRRVRPPPGTVHSPLQIHSCLACAPSHGRYQAQLAIGWLYTCATCPHPSSWTTWGQRCGHPALIGACRTGRRRHPASLGLTDGIVHDAHLLAPALPSAPVRHLALRPVGRRRWVHAGAGVSQNSAPFGHDRQGLCAWRGCNGSRIESRGLGDHDIDPLQAPQFHCSQLHLGLQGTWRGVDPARTGVLGGTLAGLPQLA